MRDIAGSDRVDDEERRRGQEPEMVSLNDDYQSALQG